MQQNAGGKALPPRTYGKRESGDSASLWAYGRHHGLYEQQETANLLTEVERLTARVREQAEQITQMEGTIASLKRQLEMDSFSLAETQLYGFGWFLKEQPAMPLIAKWLADDRLPMRSSRSVYEAYLRTRHHATEEELIRFKDLWKMMLLHVWRDGFA